MLAYIKPEEAHPTTELRSGNDFATLGAVTELAPNSILNFNDNTIAVVSAFLKLTETVSQNYQTIS